MKRHEFFLAAGVFGLLLSSPPIAAQIAVGTVMVSTGSGRVSAYTQNGTLIGQVDTSTAARETAGSAFDSAGNFYVTDFAAQQVTKFDPSGVLIGPFGNGYNADPESILFDRAGNVYVGQADGTHQILKFNPSGTLLATFSPATENRGTDHIALAPGQCTMFYTSEGVEVKRFNVCTSTQLTDFNAVPLPGSKAYTLKLLPTGGLLVADTEEVVRLDSAGNQIQTYTLPHTTLLFPVSLDPDSTSFWTADLFSGEVFKIDIASGTILQQWSAAGAPNFVDISGLSVKGEINVAASFPPPQVALPTVDQAAVKVGSHPVITVSASISYPDNQPVIPSSVKLLQIDDKGQATILATLNDNGTDGDVVAGDSIFSARVQLHAAPVGLIRLQVSAAFSNTPGTVLSPNAFVEVFPALVPFQYQPPDLSSVNICTTSTGAQEICNEILMLFNPGARFSDVQLAARSVGGTVIGLVSFPWLNSWQVQVPCSDDSCVSAVVAFLTQEAAGSSFPDLLGAEPDFLQHADQAPAPVVPNDPQFRLQWAAPIVQLPLAWSFTTGLILPARTHVPFIAIVDSGVDITHPDLNTKVTRLGSNWINPGPGNTATNDQCPHGTMVAGVAGAEGNNGFAIAGASWEASLIPIKVMRPTAQGCAGADSATARGLREAVDLGATAINYSSSRAGNPGETLASAVQYINRANRVLVATAGNLNNHDRRYPAGFSERQCFPNPPNPAQPRCYDGSNLSVGWTNLNDTLGPLSNFGAWVKIYAPGTCILATVRAGDPTVAAADPCLMGMPAPPAVTRLEFVLGTSFAAPLVSGVASLMISAKPTAGGGFALVHIPDLADGTGKKDPDGNTIFRLNAFRAVRCAATNVCQ